MIRRRMPELTAMARLCLIASICVMALTGCGDRAELPEKAFVMGIALDESDKGAIDLAVQIFRPSQTIGKGKTGKSYVTIRTEDHSVLEAIRDITIHLGRKAQWSHMRVILVGEKLARKISLIRLLDFFYRDHEPRLTSHLMVTEGHASDYLENSPFIESTVSQQYFLSEKAASRSSGKTPSLSLLELALQTKSQSAAALVPFLYMDTHQGEQSPAVAGAAALVDGKLQTIVPSKLMEGITLLHGSYESGVIEVPCGGAKARKAAIMAEDSMEILRTTNNRKIRLEADHVHYAIKQEVYVVLSELECGRTDTIKDERKFIARAEDTMELLMSESFDWLKKNRVDALGVGNWIHGHAPSVWSRWKPDWRERFSRTTYDIQVKVIVLSSGTTVGNPKFPD